MAGAVGSLTNGDFAWLFGKRSYDDLMASWNAQGGLFEDPLNRTTKHVAFRISHEITYGV